MLEFQGIKTVLLKDMLLIGQKKLLSSEKWTYVISDLNGEKTVGTFCEKESRKRNQKELRIEKIIKRKGDKLYVKWKGYDNSFNSWTDKKDIV